MSGKVEKWKSRKLTPVSMKVSFATRRNLKRVAVETGLSMQELADILIIEALENEQIKKVIKKIAEEER